ncbi:hypothetical protein [Zymomonas mobilis]|uniref:hypothetical protein n=1 Tax=Zymomonas mobilis TaxID=542 RepID=UPI0039E8BB86
MINTSNSLSSTITRNGCVFYDYSQDAPDPVAARHPEVMDNGQSSQSEETKAAIMQAYEDSQPLPNPELESNTNNISNDPSNNSSENKAINTYNTIASYSSVKQDAQAIAVEKMDGYFISMDNFQKSKKEGMKLR